MDWFQSWPEDARIGVSSHYLKSYMIVCTDQVKEQVIHMMSFIHNNVSEMCTVYYDRYTIWNSCLLIVLSKTIGFVKVPPADICHTQVIAVVSRKLQNSVQGKA